MVYLDHSIPIFVDLGERSHAAPENKHRVDYDYKVGDKVTLKNQIVYEYKTLYKGTFVITQCFTNGTVILQYGGTEMRYNIRCNKPYKLDTKVEDFDPINIFDAVNI